MRKELEDRIDPNKPALIVLCGATKRKYLPLAGDLVVLGRGAGCDLGLVSPEVGPVHCIIARLGGEWRIRDCSGRATRINGRSIQDEALRNGDVIQIGTFSFEAHLPHRSAAPAAAAVAAPQHAHLQRSRRKLAEHALNMRRQLRQARAVENELARREHDLEEMERRLRTGTQDRQERVQQAEAGLEQRKSELDHFARHLRRLEQRLRREAAVDPGCEADLVQARMDLQRERGDLAELRAELEQRHAEAEETATQLEAQLSQEREQLERDREQLAGERAYLDRQRQELIKLRAELQRKAGDTPQGHDTHMDAPPDHRLEEARRLLSRLSGQRQALSKTRTPTVEPVKR